MLNRKIFLKNLALMGTFTAFSPVRSFAQSKTNKITVDKIIPKKLEKGQTIGLVTPAGCIRNEQLDKTIEKLESFGFKTDYQDSVLSQFGYLAGTDKERANELMHMFSNKKVDAIMCVRGGYGAIRMLDLLDYDKIKANPKIFIGYSDITALNTAIYQKTGLITFHGPVGISSFNDFTMEAFDNVLMLPHEHYQFSYEREKNTEDNTEFDYYTLIGGKAKGKLLGGNLSVLNSMIGTEFEPDFEDKIAYIEEIDERTYKVDKMLTHLVQATNLRKAKGIALGIFKGCDHDEEPTFTLKQTLELVLKPLNMPIVYGLPFGHVANKMTLPTGIKVKLNADTKTLKLLDNAVK